MYNIIMIPMSRKNENGKGLKPRISATGVKGIIIVTTTIDSVAIKRYFPGRLLKKGFRLQITSTINDAEMTDSRNQLVLN